MNKKLKRKYIIAIDGGGTKTVGALADMSGEVICFHVRGATNPNDVGVKRAAEELAGLVCELADEAEGWISAIFAGVSGSIGYERQLEDAIRDACPDTKVRVASDIYNLFGLLDGDPDRDAAAFICGTGSVCFARVGGTLHRIGGWGYLLDTDGGAYSVGRDGLEAALRAVDGRGEKTLLSRYAEEYLGTPPQLAISRIYENGKVLIAGFAPEVFRAANDGDAVALGIVRKCVSGAAELLLTAKEKIGLPEIDCIVSGGMTADRMMKEMLTSSLEGKGVDLVFPLREQIRGAIVQAINMLGKD